MHRRHATMVLAAAAVVLAACTSGSGEIEVAEDPSLPASTPQVLLDGAPPEGGVDIQIADQRRVIELTLAPPGMGEEIDVTKPAPDRAEEFVVTVDVADAPSETTSDEVHPVRIPFTTEPVTVTYTPAPGEPDTGTLTVEFENGEQVSAESTGDHPPLLLEARVAYEVALTWPSGNPGYAVVLRGEGTGTGNNQPGSARQFTEAEVFELALGLGESMAVVVYDGIASITEAREVPGIIPGSGVTTVVAPDE